MFTTELSMKAMLDARMVAARVSRLRLRESAEADATVVWIRLASQGGLVAPSIRNPRGMGSKACRERLWCGVLLLEREYAVNLRDHRSAFADCGSDAFGRTGTYISNREHAGHAGSSGRAARPPKCSLSGKSCPVRRKPLSSVAACFSIHPAWDPRRRTERDDASDRFGWCRWRGRGM